MDHIDAGNKDMKAHISQAHVDTQQVLTAQINQLSLEVKQIATAVGVGSKRKAEEELQQDPRQEDTKKNTKKRDTKKQMKK